MTCSRCRFDNETGNLYCGRCGDKLSGELAPQDTEQEIKKGQELFQQGRKREAIAVFESLLQAAPSHPALYSYLGALYSQTGLKRDAVAAFFAAVQSNPKNPNAYFNLGVACRNQDMLREAIECFQAALRIKPDYEQARQALQATTAARDAIVQNLSLEFSKLRTQGEFDALEKLCDRILTLNPNHLPASNIKAELLEKNGWLLEAMRFSREMSKKFPQATLFQERCKRLEPLVGAQCSTIELIEEGKALLSQRDFAAALAKAEGAHRASPHSASALALQGAIHEAQGTFNKAKQAYQSATKIDPHDKEALNGLQRIARKDLAGRRKLAGDMLQKAGQLRRDQKPNEAMAVLQQANQFLSDDPVLHLLTGLLHKERGDLARAVEELEKAVQLDRKFAPGLRHLHTARLLWDRQLHRQASGPLTASRSLLQRKEYALCLDQLSIAQHYVGLRRSNGMAPLVPITDTRRRESLQKQEFNIYASIGQAHEALEAFPQAVAAYDTVATLQPKNPKALKLRRAGRSRQQKKVQYWLGHAKAWRKNKNYAKAAEDISKALQYDPTSLAAHLHLGAVLECARQFNDALNVYANAQRFHPQADIVRQRIGAAQERAHKWAQIQRRQSVNGVKTAAVAARVAFRLFT